MLRVYVGLLGLMFAVLVYCAPATAIEKKAPLVHHTSGNVAWSISAQAGLQTMDLDFDAPLVMVDLGAFGGGTLFHPSSLHLQLHSGNLCVGGIGADIKKGRFSSFLELNANMPRDTNVTAFSEPFWAGIFPVEFYHGHFKWWAINAGAGADITAHFSIQAGLRVAHLSLGLANPIDSVGLIPYFQSTYGDSYSGSLKSDLLIPWVGVRVQANRLKGFLRFSPLARTKLQIPFDYNFVASSTQTIVEHEQYSFEHYGFWLGCDIAWDFYKTTSWSCSLLAHASWLWTNGTTSDTYQAVNYVAGSPPTTSPTDSGFGEGKYQTVTYGIGLRINYYSL